VVQVDPCLLDRFNLRKPVDCSLTIAILIIPNDDVIFTAMRARTRSVIICLTLWVATVFRISDYRCNKSLMHLIDSARSQHWIFIHMGHIAMI
jgi:hypothetical protein